jgi:predicted PurR-regulated permease PerM
VSSGGTAGDSGPLFIRESSAAHLCGPKGDGRDSSPVSPASASGDWLRLSAILAESARYLRRWLLGQLIGMVVLGLLTAAALIVLGVPDAMLLALLADLFNFVSYLRAVAAGIPIVLMTIPLGPTTAVLAIAVYIVIHLGIGYVLAPLIQQRTVRLLPAFTLASLMLFGMLFGLVGLALATPLAVVIRQIAPSLHLDMAAFDPEPDPPV